MREAFPECDTMTSVTIEGANRESHSVYKYELYASADIDASIKFPCSSEGRL